METSPVANDPMKQFEVRTVPDNGRIESFQWIDFTVTNITVFTFAVVLSVIAFVAITSNRAALVPGRTQSLGELSYEFVSGMIRDIIGEDGMKFFPFIFTLFMFVLFANLIGMIPIFPTVTSQLAITLTLGLISIISVIIYGIINLGPLGFLKLFFPPGLPVWLLPLIGLIEIISFLARPFTLGLRLFANMLAGHVLLKVFGGFVVALGSLGAFGALGAVLPFLGVFFVTALEFLVAFLQAYVFAILTVIYLNDVVHGHH
jgi:F-type H+-transporting ATPase subunit a